MNHVHPSTSIITNDGNVEFKDAQICGRNIPLKELRVELLNKQEN